MMTKSKQTFHHYSRQVICSLLMPKDILLEVSVLINPERIRNFLRSEGTGGKGHKKHGRGYLDHML